MKTVQKTYCFIANKSLAFSRRDLGLLSPPTPPRGPSATGWRWRAGLSRQLAFSSDLEGAAALHSIPGAPHPLQRESKIRSKSA